MQTLSPISTHEPRGCLLLSVATKMVKVSLLETHRVDPRKWNYAEYEFSGFFLICLKCVLAFQLAPEGLPEAQAFVPGDADTPDAPTSVPAYHTAIHESH